MVQAKGEVQKLIVKAQDGALEAQPGRTIMESFEGQVNAIACSRLRSSSRAVLPAMLVFVYVCHIWHKPSSRCSLAASTCGLPVMLLHMVPVIVFTLLA